jgi:hypothetical protein
MNKALARILFPLLIIAAGAAFALSLAPSGSSQANMASRARDRSSTILASARQPALPNQPATPTATPEAVSTPGSTDGIVIMGIAIVAIIVIPILLQRGLWMK